MAKIVPLSEAIAELSRYLLIEGATLAYGGHLGSDGYMQTLFELVRTYNSDLDSEMRADLIVNFRGWPAPRLSVQKQAALFVSSNWRPGFPWMKCGLRPRLNLIIDRAGRKQ